MIFEIASSYYYAVTVILAGVVGLCVGSFLNVVIYRVPLGMSLATPPSHCPKCNYQLKWYDNIPVLSYCLLGGKCRKCKEPISFRYTAVEIANMLLWLLAAFFYRENVVYMGIAMLTSSVAICIFFIDIEHMIIPDRFQIILGILGVLSIFVDKMWVWYDHLIGAAVGFASFYAIGFLVGKAVGREALGGGDIKLAAVSGLLLGWEKFLLMMLLSSISASIVMTVKRRKKGEVEVPFGPFLSAGLLISLFVGDILIDGYLSLLLY